MAKSRSPKKSPKKRALSEYQKFVKKQLSAGHTMKEAAAMWRKTSKGRKSAKKSPKRKSSKRKSSKRKSAKKSKSPKRKSKKSPKSKSSKRKSSKKSKSPKLKKLTKKMEKMLSEAYHNVIAARA